MANMSIFLFTVHYQGAHILNYLENAKSPKKDVINIENDDNKFFLWCHIKNLNPSRKKITKVDRHMVNVLAYGDIKFYASKRITARLKKKTSVLMYLVMKMVWSIQFMDFLSKLYEFIVDNRL